MNRRGFLTSILALAVTPAIVRASSLMPITAAMDDAGYLQGLIDAAVGRGASYIRMPSGLWTLERSLIFPAQLVHIDGGNLGANEYVVKGKTGFELPGGGPRTVTGFHLRPENSHYDSRYAGITFNIRSQNAFSLIACERAP